MRGESHYIRKLSFIITFGETILFYDKNRRYKIPKASS